MKSSENDWSLYEHWSGCASVVDLAAPAIWHHYLRS